MKWLETNTTGSGAQTLRSHRSAFEPVAFLLVIVLFGWFMFKPAWTSLGLVKQEVTRLQDEKRLLQEKQESLNQLTRQLTTKKADVEKLDVLLPTNIDPSSLYYLVEQLALNVGLLGTSVTVTPEPEEIVAGNIAGEFVGKHELRETELTVRGNGTIDQLQGFLKAIETAPRLIEVKNMEISSSAAGQLIFTLQMVAYSFAPTQEEAKE